MSYAAILIAGAIMALTPASALYNAAIGVIVLLVAVRFAAYRILRHTRDRPPGTTGG